MKSVAVFAALAASGNAMSIEHDVPLSAGLLQTSSEGLLAMGGNGACKVKMSKQECAMAIAMQIVSNSRACIADHQEESAYKSCVTTFCEKDCGKGNPRDPRISCQDLCTTKGNGLFKRLLPKAEAAAAPPPQPKAETAAKTKEELKKELKVEQNEQADAMKELQEAQGKMVALNDKIKAKAESDLKSGNKAKGEAEMAKVKELASIGEKINGHLANVQAFSTVATKELHQSGMGLIQKGNRAPTFLQVKAPEDELAKEMTHDLEMNFNKIAPFGKEDTAKELQDHAAKTQDTLVDAVENAEVAEIKRAVFRALTRLRAATIKEFDTIARLETQAIDAYNDAHHYRAENPLAHLHEDEAPVETDKLKSFH